MKHSSILIYYKYKYDVPKIKKTLPESRQGTGTVSEKAVKYQDTLSAARYRLKDITDILAWSGISVNKKRRFRSFLRRIAGKTSKINKR
jgi:hypothetical protein